MGLPVWVSRVVQRVGAMPISQLLVRVVAHPGGATCHAVLARLSKWKKPWCRTA